MQIAKPWVMYKSIEEIGEAIQRKLAEALNIPVLVGLEEEKFLVVLQFPGSQAHVTFSLPDIKAEYSSVENLVNFLVDCYEESMKEAKNENEKKGEQ